MMILLRLCLFLVLLCPLSLALAEEDFDKQEIQKRIAPIGRLRVEGEAKGQSSLKPKAVTATKPLSGQSTYEAHCVVCHGEGVAGAPKFRNKEDWQARLAKADLKELVNIAKKGLNAMPAKGTCNECSDDDLKNAIQYMLPKKEP